MARRSKAAETLRRQINAAAPNRQRHSDGWIGDAAHRSRKSDHNPNAAGVVLAEDITHDPKGGMDAGALAEVLRREKDARLDYVIHNKRIFSKAQGWSWRSYSGHPHTGHVHISFAKDPKLYDDGKDWTIV
jgi:hypothetical protein